MAADPPGLPVPVTPIVSSSADVSQDQQLARAGPVANQAFDAIVEQSYVADASGNFVNVCNRNIHSRWRIVFLFRAATKC